VTIPTIIWLEDEADSLDTATAAITSQGVNIEYCNTPEDLVNLAEAITTGGPAADALGVPTGAYLLSDGTSQGTQDGYEAGLKVASLILRFADSPYNDVPLLVLSARSADAQQMNYIETLPGQVKPVFIEKFLTNWEKEVEVWVSALLKGREQ
jgi:hypothetical protein